MQRWSSEHYKTAWRQHPGLSLLSPLNETDKGQGGRVSEQGIDGIVEQDVRKTFYVGGVHVVCATASRDACCHACLRPDASFTHLVKVHSELEWRQCLQPPVCEILLRYPSFRFLSWLSAEHLASAYILGCAARLPSSQ